MNAEMERKLRLHGQEGLIEGHEKAPSAALLADIATIDLEEVTASFAAANNNNNDLKIGEADSAPMVPVDPACCESVSEAGSDKLDRYFKVALEAVSREVFLSECSNIYFKLSELSLYNKYDAQFAKSKFSRSEVGLICLAGGQGTRLGVPYPKGMYDIRLPSGKSLYQIQLERARRLAAMARERTGRECTVPVFVMTSEHTKGSTEAFFRKNNHFGMDPKDVVLFEQRMIPCLTDDGKVIRESRDKVARAPDGNGGLYWALDNEGVLDTMSKRGVKYLHVYCVDNVLVKVADPLFMGYCIEKGAEAGNKVVEKAFPDEAVGVVCKVNGRVQVVEYSEIPKDVSERREAGGKLAFRAANICNHFFTAEFLRRVCAEHLKELPQHIARKKIPAFNAETGATEKPAANNGIKLEKFVFDVFQFARDGKFVVWECLRDDEFSPLKNADGAGKSDTPTTARRALYALHRNTVHNDPPPFNPN